MRFVMGDFLGAGGIGFVYWNTGGYILAHLLFFVIAILTIIGAIQAIKWILVGFPKKKKY